MDFAKTLKIEKLGELKKHESEYNKGVWYYQQGDHIVVKEVRSDKRSELVLERTFLNTDDTTSQTVVYTEVFSYKNENEPTADEQYISQIKIKDQSDKKEIVIGYRYYDPSNGDYFTIVKDSKVQQYTLLEEDKEPGDCIQIVMNIIRDHFEGIKDYQIIGNKHQAFGILTALRKMSGDNVIVPFGIGGRTNVYWTNTSSVKETVSKNKSVLVTRTFFKELYETYSSDDGFSIEEFFKNYIDENFCKTDDKSYIMLRNDLSMHSTCFFIQLKPEIKLYLFDSSTWHCYPVKRSDKYKGKCEFFGVLGEKIEMLNPRNLQINSTCSFWNTCFQIVVARDYKDRTVENIIEDCENGVMWLKIAIEMGKILILK